jgi:DNA repair exonuclease SbcCD nuclease subunit
LNVVERISDYKHIYKHTAKGPVFSEPNDTIALHEENVNWLKNTIDTNSNKDIIILSHHLPSYKLIAPTYLGSGCNSAFATNLEHIIKPNIKYWVCGHTHTSNSASIGNCKLITNPFGHEFRGVPENKNRANDCVIEF